ncbi:MAG: DUF935 family protein [Polyangiaceae bacterium]|nr:DUF935 family protein [Polyangiaceae bacterium]
MASLWQRTLSALGFGDTRRGTGPSAKTIKEVRDRRGGNIAPLPQVQLQYLQRDLVSAQYAAAQGIIGPAAKIMAYARQDGLFSGLLQTRTSGLVRLPKRFYGDSDITQELAARTGTESLFDWMCPPSELAALVADGDLLGVGVAEIRDVPGFEFPRLYRLDPQFLRYRFETNQWFFQSVVNEIEIRPGEGKFVIHLPYGLTNPWAQGLWAACGRAVIMRDHAELRRMSYSAKHSLPARIATAPLGTDEPTRQDWLDDLEWSENAVLEVPQGFDVKLLESNGRGYEIYQVEVDNGAHHLMIALAGQVVSTEGGKGFSTTDLHRSIRADIIQASASALAGTLNTQFLPLVSVMLKGEEVLRDRSYAQVEYDTRQPKDMASQASTLVAVGTAITTLSEGLAKFGEQPDVRRLMTDFDIPLLPKKVVEPLDIEIDTSDFDDPKSEGVDVDQLAKVIDLAERVGLQPTKQSISAVAGKLGVTTEDLPVTSAKVAKLDLAPTDLAKVVRTNEARQSQGLPPIEDPKGEKFISELGQPEAEDPLVGIGDQE